MKVANSVDGAASCCLLSAQERTMMLETAARMSLMHLFISGKGLLFNDFKYKKITRL